MGNRSKDRATLAIEQSCKAMEARLLHAVTCDHKSVGTSNDVTHNVTDKMPEPGSDPPPSPPIDISLPDLQVPRSGAQRTLQCGTTAHVVDCVEAWANGTDNNNADDSEPSSPSIQKNATFKTLFKSSNSQRVQSQHNQVRQLIGAHRHALYGLDPHSLRGKLDTYLQGRVDTSWVS